MKIVVPPIYERDGDVIREDSDFFKRKVFADNLTRLFLNSNSGMVVSIDAKWGDGKTAFVRSWIERLKNKEELLPIYFDAYKNDFTSDAFLSIAAAIQKNLPKSKIREKSAALWDGLVDSTVKVAQDSIKLGVGLAVTSLSAGMVNGREFVDGVGERLGDVIGGAISYEAKERLQTHLEAEDNIEHYKKALERLLRASDKEKIVFFVDELDRCRPDFAMQVIEKIKHLFSVEGVIFVLVINKDQLAKTVAHAYGVSGKDAEIYLQKFIHIETKLPGINNKLQDGLGGFEEYIGSLLGAHEIPKHALSFRASEFYSLVGNKCLDMNPRAIERAFALAAMVLMTMDDADGSEMALVFFSAAIKIGAPDFYGQYRTGHIPVSIGSSLPGAIGERCGDIISKAFDGYFDRRAANVIVFKEVAETCSRIDMFTRI